jgi:hypothetical protein
MGMYPLSPMALACCGQDLEALNRPWIRVGILAGTGERRPGSVLNSSKSRWRGDLRIVRRGRNGCTVFWWPSLESDFQASNQHSPWRSSRRESLTSPPRASGNWAYMTQVWISCRCQCWKDQCRLTVEAAIIAGQSGNFASLTEDENEEGARSESRVVCGFSSHPGL